MTDLCRLIFWTLVDLMRARATLEAEIWVLRQQINVLRRAAPRRQSFGIFDRLIFVGLYRLFPKACDALVIVKPDTIIRWHRRAPSNGPDAFFVAQFSAGYTTNMFGFDLRQGQPTLRRLRSKMLACGLKALGSSRLPPDAWQDAVSALST